mmetsp:Transcript_48387/g.72170  ORF Transcript_48387/g.72170 Transcript_48387/m.72170 type:complete len:203 (+) Transcript_48387:928-1536(+)
MLITEKSSLISISNASPATFAEFRVDLRMLPPLPDVRTDTSSSGMVMLALPRIPGPNIGRVPELFKLLREAPTPPSRRNSSEKSIDAILLSTCRAAACVLGSDLSDELTPAAFARSSNTSDRKDVLIALAGINTFFSAVPAGLKSSNISGFTLIKENSPLSMISLFRDFCFPAAKPGPTDGTEFFVDLLLAWTVGRLFAAEP